MTGKKFGKSYRLSKGQEFEKVIQEGRKIISPDAILWCYKSEENPGEGSPSAPTRLGTSLSRKLGEATLRNRIKRLLREAFRLNRHRMKGGYDLVIYPRPGCRWKNLGDAETSLQNLFRRAGILQESI